MKWMKTIVVVLSIVALLGASTVFAQQRPQGQSPAAPSAPASRSDAQEPGTLKSTTPEPPPVPRASIFIGSSVMNAQGESLGKIEDLVIDPATGRITYAALSHGGVLGIGGKLYAVAWEAFKLQPDGKSFVLDVPKETLETAQSFDKSNWPKQPDPTLSASARGTGMGMKPSAQAGAGASTGMKPSTETAASSSLNGISATVQEVNAQGETIKLKTERGETVELQAPAAMLAGLQAGDAVEVKMVGTRATEIHKKH